MLATRQHHTDDDIAIVPDNDIHHGFCSITCRWQTVVESAEQAFTYALTMAANDEGCSRIICHLPYTIIFFVLNNLCQATAQSLPRLL